MTDVLDPAEVVSVRRSKMPVILAGAVAVALVLSIGAYVGYRFLFGGTQPAERMPGSVIAYISVDLTPSLGQSKNLRDLARKFPESSQDTDPKTTVTRLLEKAAPGNVDMKRDVASWLGLRAAAGAWLDNAGNPYLVIAAQSTDDKAAAAGLASIKDKVKDGFGYTIRDGYALIAFGEKAGQAAADAASAEAERSPLAKAAKYTDARAWLADEQFAYLFADLDAVGKLQRDMMTKEFGDDVGVIEPGFGSAFPMPTGTVIGGIRAQDDGLIARFRASGSKSGNGTVPDALATLGAMPAATSVGLVARVPDEMPGASFGLFGMVGFLPMMIGGGFEEEGETPPGAEPSGNLTAAEQAEFEQLMTKQITGDLTAKEQKRLDELLKKMSVFTPRDLTPAEEEELAKLMAKGENLTEAEQKRISELLGMPTGPYPVNRTGEAMAELFKLIPGGLVTATASESSGKTAFRAVIELAQAPGKESADKVKGLSDKDVTVSVDGKSITVRSAMPLTDGGRLADEQLFARAIAGAPTADVQTAFYLNTSKVSRDQSDGRPSPVKAICLVQHLVGSDQVSQLRILIG